MAKVTKSTKSKSTKNVYVVQRGGLDDHPEQVEIIGLFGSLKDARKRVREEYRLSCAADWYEGSLPPLPRSFYTLDDGQMFWSISTHPL